MYINLVSSFWWPEKKKRWILINRLVIRKSGIFSIWPYLIVMGIGYNVFSWVRKNYRIEQLKRNCNEQRVYMKSQNNCFFLEQMHCIDKNMLIYGGSQLLIKGSFHNFKIWYKIYEILEFESLMKNCLIHYFLFVKYQTWFTCGNCKIGFIGL